MRLPVQVDPTRARAWVRSAATQTLDPAQPKLLLPARGGRPRFGDVVICRVSEIGEVNFVETSAGIDYPLCPEATFVGVISTRYALDVHVAKVPTELKGVHLLNNGGTVGTVTSSNRFVRNPTELNMLAYLGDADGRRLNTRTLGPALIPGPVDLGGTKLILAVGAGMNYGKTTSAAGACYCLNRSGKKVVAGKATGTARSKDIRLMQSQGASTVSDFVALGYPATYLLREEELLRVFWSLVDRLVRSEPQYIVIEIADGVRQRETSMLLRSPAIREATHRVIYACGDADAAYGGVSYLRKLGYGRIVVSGMVANSPAGMDEVRSVLGRGVPIFDGLDRGDPRVGAKLFQ